MQGIGSQIWQGEFYCILIVNICCDCILNSVILRTPIS